MRKLNPTNGLLRDLFYYWGLSGFCAFDIDYEFKDHDPYQAVVDELSYWCDDGL